MLEPRHIIKLHINRDKLDAHRALPKPAYINTPRMAQFSTINDAILTEVFNIPLSQFKDQLKDARNKGVELLCRDNKNDVVGISAATSSIKGRHVVTKRLIIPMDMVKYDRSLSDHLIIAAFIRGDVQDNKIQSWNNSVELAGWTTVEDIIWRNMGNDELPDTFRTKLSVIHLPCRYLNPMATLPERLAPESVLSLNNV